MLCIITRPHCSTTQPIVTDRVAWSVRLSVCLSVCHDCKPCKNGCTNRDAVWIVDLDRPKEPCIIIRWGRDIPCEGAVLRWKGAPLWTIGTPCHELCKNGWTDQDAVWVLSGVCLRKHVLDGGPDPPSTRIILRGEGAAHYKLDLLPWAV